MYSNSQDAYAANSLNVKTGTCTIAVTLSSTTCAISPALTDTTKTFMVFQATSSDNTVNSSNVRCFIASTVTITCERNSTTGTVNIRWHTSEFTSGVKVQHLQPLSCAGTTTNVTITSVDTSKTFLLYSYESDGTTQDGNDFRAIRLTNSTNVEIVFSSGSCGVVEQALQVVEYSGASVTRGLTGAMAASSTTLSVSSLSSVNTSKTMLIYSYRTAASANPDMCEDMIRGEITTATSLTFSRGDGAAGCATQAIDAIAWERIEFTDGSTVQQVTATMSSGTGTANVSINAVDTSKTIVFAGGQWTNGQAIGEGSFQTDDTIGTMTGRHALISSTNLQVTRDNTGGTARWTSYVVQFDPMQFYTVKHDSFTKSTAAAPASQSITGIGFKPKAVIFFWTAQTSTGNNPEVAVGYGFTTGPLNERAIAMAADDDDTTGDAVRRQSQSNAIIILDPDGTEFRAAAELTSFDADGFTINWTTNESVATIIHYIAIGGSDLTNALASSFTITTGAGTQSITGVGFRPDFLMFISMDTTTMDSTLLDTAKASIGFASSPTEEAGIGVALSPTGIAISDTFVRQRTDNAIVELTDAGAEDTLADLQSFDSDGFTINKSSSSDATVFHYLALKGGGYKVGSFNKSTGAAPASQSITGVGFKPTGMILASKNLAANTAIEAEGRISFGASDGTMEGATWFHDKDGLDTTDANKRTSTTKVAVHASQTTLNAEADLTSFNTDGFTLNWTTNNAIAEEIVYVALERGGGKELEETVSASDAKTNQSTKIVSDTLALTDTMAKTFSKVVAETLTSLDGITKASTKSLSENISLSDTLTTATQLVKNINESLALADTNVRAFSRKLDETLTLTDTVNGKIPLKIIQETLALTDTVNARITLKNMQETLALADAVVKSSVRNIGDTLSISDSAVASSVLTKLLTETMSLADGIIAQNGLIKQLSETIGIADVLSTLGSNIRNLTETLGLTDVVANTHPGTGTKETATLVDILTVTHTVSVTTGSSVAVNLLTTCGTLTGGSVTFPSVSSAGTVSITPKYTGYSGPSGFTVVGLGGSVRYLDISTSATFTGAADICVTYDDTGLTPEQESVITLQHFNGATWEDITTSRDNVANIVYGRTSSFSAFAVMFDNNAFVGGGGDDERRRYDITDTSPPQILVQDYKPDAPVEGREVIVTAKLIDDTGIANAFMLCFINDSEHRFEKFEMKMYSPQWYQGTIPAHDIIKAGMTYSLFVQDLGGNVVQSASYEIVVQEAVDMPVKPSQTNLPEHVLAAIQAKANAKASTESVEKIEVTSTNSNTSIKSYQDKIIIRNVGSRSVDDVRLMLSPELANGFKLGETAIKSIKPNSNVTVSFNVIGNPNKDMMGNLVSHEGVVIVAAEHHKPIFLPVSIGSEEKSELGDHMKNIRNIAEQRYNKISLLNEILTKHQKTQYKYEVKTSDGGSIIRNPSGEVVIKNLGSETIRNIRLFITTAEYPFHLEQSVIGELGPNSQISIKMIPKVNVNYSPKDIKGDLLIVPANDRPVQVPIEIAKQNIKIDEFAVNAVLGGDRIFTGADQIIIKNGNRTLDSVRLFLSGDLARVFMLSNDSFQHIEPNSEVTIDLKFRGIDGDQHIGLQYNYEGELVIVSEHHTRQIIPISIVWNEVESEGGHFTVYARNDEVEIVKANELVEFLESNYNDVVKRFGDVRTKTKIYMANAAEFRIISESDSQSNYAFTDDLIFVCSCTDDLDDVKSYAMKEFVYRIIINKYPNYSNKEKFIFDNENWLIDGIANYIAAGYAANYQPYVHTASNNVTANNTAHSIIHQEMIHSQIESFMEKPTSFVWYGVGTAERYGATYTFFEYLHDKYGEGAIDWTLYYLGSGMISNTRCDTLEDCAVLRAVYDESGLDMRKKRYTLDIEALVNEWEDYVRENYDVAIDIVYRN
jgi:hypothetical protein